MKSRTLLLVLLACGLSLSGCKFERGLAGSGIRKTEKRDLKSFSAIDTSKLRADNAKVEVSGAASVDVYAAEQLDVNVSGAGRVSYSGNPKTVNKHVSGIGSVNPSGG